MKKPITSIAVSAAITAIALAKADKACWTTSQEQWPAPNAVGWHPLVPVVGQYSGGAVASVQYASMSISTLLVKVTTTINAPSQRGFLFS